MGRLFVDKAEFDPTISEKEVEYQKFTIFSFPPFNSLLLTPY